MVAGRGGGQDHGKPFFERQTPSHLQCNLFVFSQDEKPGSPRHKGLAASSSGRGKALPFPPIASSTLLPAKTKSKSKYGIGLSPLSLCACCFEVTVTSVSLPPFVSHRGLLIQTNVSLSFHRMPGSVSTAALTHSHCSWNIIKLVPGVLAMLPTRGPEPGAHGLVLEPHYLTPDL